MINLLKRVPLFADLTDAQLEIVSSITSRREYDPHTILFQQGDPGQTFCIVVRGAVKVYTSNKQGQQKILAVFQAGDSFGELALIDGKPRSATAETLEEDTVLLTVTSESFHLLLRAHYDIAKQVMVQLCSRLRATNGHVYDLTFLDAPSRVVKYIVRIAQQQGERRGDKIIIRSAFDPDAMSGLAGVHRNVLEHVIRDLEHQRILFLGASEYSLDISKLFQSPYIS
ncbi:Crp/Fnr family transcriptional regulator [Paenibacillus apiarius]|uniref:Crp/Fnr family transcriptional regulator n=1 Tax=Paenibacillus apiarius TaxID=46240 RepID=A0ABT4DYU9_9BACL|nr:Crp/Fnr family transcriptional regulator [Paenibacillus apiarius]MCY9516528.1 Crp/Fnr family transcriptional regulator [Paenibacillus apiarius]MCY9522519.1 Crp/Fnr family transcriptional regulator [Paenibacillus apiarius]MCY9554557.1 Crp/Fnr family transcriptional regulator [Paenibacillus apiarius]MCY9556673.1 Crp/Fnr family transcriptional regulator [Paenibacillus apiarius]MCY9686646.1 Crp/Fnr family transcriptional regulator [Paenibacillus apiarius]